VLIDRRVGVACVLIDRCVCGRGLCVD